MSAPDDLPPDWRDLDGIRSYEAAIAELRRRHLAGEPARELPMFQPRKPLAIDLCCGLGGWAEGLLAEGYDVIGFDIERHQYGAERYPGALVIQDMTTLHGSQFRKAALIVASPPCQEYSYMAMPWSLAKAKAAVIRADKTGQALADLNRLFDACFRIQAQASLAAGRKIPMVVENVRGAQPWVGRARWNFGSFYLWGDVPALMPFTKQAAKMPGHNMSRGSPIWGPHTTGGYGQKVPGFRFDGTKCGGDWFNSEQPSISRLASSKSPARKAASAMIAKIPLPLSRHIAATFKPSSPLAQRPAGGDKPAHLAGGDDLIAAPPAAISEEP